MGLLSRLGGVLLVVVAIGTAFVLRGPNHDARALVRPGPVVAAVSFWDAGGGEVRPWHQISIPSSTAEGGLAPVGPAYAAEVPPPAASRIVIGSTQQALINRDRAAAGLQPLSWSSCLYSVALANARRMAAQGAISHTNGPSVDLSCGLGSYAGENVGFWTGGVNDAQLNTMFMNSPDHRANIMGPYHYVATAWVTAPNGAAYIAVEAS